MRRRMTLTLALVGVLAAREASGDVWHIKTPSVVVTEKGSKLDLPPGYFLDEEAWRERDLELKRLQEQETRLKAENRSLRKTVAADAIPWRVIVCAMAFGAAAGIIGWQMQ